MLLGIESTADLVGVALRDDQRVRAACSLLGRRHHTERLAPAIQVVLEEAGTALEEVDAIALDVGPGLFNGIRVGVATAKGLAQGLGVGILALNSLEVTAAGVAGAGWGSDVLAVVDARRGDVFSARYRPSGGDVRELDPPRRIFPSELAERARPDEPLLLVGDGALRYRDSLLAGEACVLAASNLCRPDPCALVELAAIRIAQGAAPVPGTDVMALYMGEPSTRINWSVREDAARGPS
ncbi:MAG: tRNA (adenosine(37)-N6)-threonylcarbamoyltransferase complex dimerization subunit type 1 TsaB [Acidimicrobiales bacterium]